MTTLIILCFFTFLAGFIDAVVGGGGLIQLPALLLTLPQYPVPKLLGTGKIPSFTGTFVAAIQYGKKIPFQWSWLLVSGISAAFCSFIGSNLVGYLDNRVLKPLILLLLIMVAIYTITKKDFGEVKKSDIPLKYPLWVYGVSIGSVLGLYDGFFGPGTGSFLVLAFIGILGFDFLTASAHAKVVNLFTNLGSIIIFGWQQNIIWQYALPMSVFNLLGSFLGSRMAILKGNAFVKNVFLFVILLMIVRYGYDILK